MRRRAPAWRAVLPALGAGVCVGSIEVLLVAATQPQLFLSIKEFLRAALIMISDALSLTTMLVLACGLVVGSLRRVAPDRIAPGIALVAGLITCPTAAWLFWELSEGRRVRSHQLRPVVVCVAALVAAAAAMGLALFLLRVVKTPRTSRRPLFVALMLVAAGTFACDLFVLRRLYPAFHGALAAAAVVTGACGAAAWPVSPPARRWLSAWLCSLGVITACAAPFWLRGTRDAPNLHYALEQASPLSGKLLRLFRARATEHIPPPLAAPARGVVPAQPGIVLRGDDILLITVDALRADRLQAYGARNALTPTLDKLAAESVVFTRAYTQTPHTSYALGSLFTGKYLRPVLALVGATQTHATLPRLLRRYGYRTAAFYPPAVFFVDEERFVGLADDHFGFEYVKEMFAPAADRVPQLREYLAQADKAHPLFVWVHLFEPHEPYDPAPGFARGDELEQRYDGEVAAADAAISQLIEVFRAHKPQSTVIVSADHGEEFGDHGGYHHGTTLFDEQVRVPLLWSSPGRAPARRVTAPVQLIDLAPTLLAALGIPRDARMRGADLAPILAGATPSAQLRAFASTDELRMWTDGDYKLVCDSSQAACRLYDLLHDPAETRDASGEQPERLIRMSHELSELVASIPDVEAISMQGGEGWPKALARARLGDASAGPELLPLLGDERLGVRREAVRAVAALKVAAALPIVSTLESQDADAIVRDEAALAALTLLLEAASAAHGTADAGPSQVITALAARVQQALLEARTNETEGLDFARRAAFALLPSEPDPAADIIADLAADSGASKTERERALAALAEAHVSELVPRLIDLLDDVRLRPAVASALGALGGADAQRALSNALVQERYPEARGAEASALVTLGDRTAKALIVRMLGTETGVPGGLALWARLGGGRGPHGQLLDLRNGQHGSSLRGNWHCEIASAANPAGCSPSDTASLSPSQLPHGELRAVLEVSAPSSGAWLQFGDQTFVLRQGQNEVALAISAAPRATTWPVHASPAVRIALLGFVPRTPDIPPPAPEPDPNAGGSDATRSAGDAGSAKSNP